MSKTWSQVATEIKTWQTNNPGQTKSILLTAGQIAAINAQIEQGADALDIYLGEDSNGQINGYAIAAMSDGNGNYNDWNIPTNQTDFDSAVSSGTIPLKRDAQPCPTYCRSANYLNS